MSMAETLDTRLHTDTATPPARKRYCELSGATKLSVLWGRDRVKRLKTAAWGHDLSRFARLLVAEVQLESYMAGIPYLTNHDRSKVAVRRTWLRELENWPERAPVQHLCVFCDAEVDHRGRCARCEAGVKA